MANKKMKNKNIWIIPIIIFGIITVLIITAFIIKLCFTTVYDDIGWADWLMACCSLLSMAGTITLSCVALKQNERTNDINYKLQEINDYQFKVANQALLPVLQPNEISFRYDGEADGCISLNNWEKNYSTDLSGKTIIVDVDCRFDKNVSAKYMHLFTFKLTNKSKSVIKDLRIYKIDFNSPFNNIVNTDYQAHFILTENESIGFKYRLLYEEERKTTTKHTGMSIYIEITLISGIKFYEKVTVFSDSDFLESDGVVDKLEENKILN